VDRRQFADHHDRIVRIVAEVHQLTAVVTLLSFSGYAAAAVLWYRDQMWPALGAATVSYLVFRAFRPLSLSLARWRLGLREGYAETFSLLGTEITQRGARRVMAELEAMIEATASGANRPR